MTDSPEQAPPPKPASRKGGWWQFIVVAVFGAAVLYVMSEPGPGQLNKWVGVEAPELHLTTVDGQELSLADLRGKRVMLDFWATWCPPCIQEIPDLMALDRELSDEDYVIVGISDEPEDTIRAFAHTNSIPYPMVAAQRLPEPYRYITSIPTKLIIDRNGVIQDVAVGMHSKAELKTMMTADDYQGRVRPSPYHEGSATH